MKRDWQNVDNCFEGEWQQMVFIILSPLSVFQFSIMKRFLCKQPQREDRATQRNNLDE